MRFGKKLALQVQEDNSGAPYLSHKPMKEAINRTVRELRIYQSLHQSQAWCGTDVNGFPIGSEATSAAQSAELAQLEERVAALDQQLFNLVDEDLARILSYIRDGEGRLAGNVAKLQGVAIEAGIIFEEHQLQRLEKLLPSVPADRAALSRQLLELRLRSDATGMARHLEGIANTYNGLVELADQHTQYLEINVAGFRKLLKRHEKQIPHRFRSRPMPCLGFHRLVTHTSRQLLDLTRQLGCVLRDAQQRLVEQAPIVGTAMPWMGPRIAGMEIREIKGLGPECETVLDIQKQLKDPMNSQLVQLATVSAPQPGFLYPKPSSTPPGGSAKASASEQADDKAVRHPAPQLQ